LDSTGIENPDNFTIEQDNSQTIYFRILKTGGTDSGCFVTGEAFDIVVARSMSQTSKDLTVANKTKIDGYSSN